jgi:hypothetical protein
MYRNYSKEVLDVVLNNKEYDHRYFHDWRTYLTIHNKENERNLANIVDVIKEEVTLEEEERERLRRLKRKKEEEEGN